MICRGENETNGCHLAGFSEDIAFASHWWYRTVGEIAWVARTRFLTCMDLASWLPAYLLWSLGVI